MMTPNGKKLILWFLSLVLCITSCAPAFASVGDRILIHNNSVDGYVSDYIQDVLPCGNGFCIISRTDDGQNLTRYADAKAEPEKFLLDYNVLNGGEETEGAENTEEAENADDEEFSFSDSAESTSSYVETWFGYNGEIYAILCKTTYTQENNETELLVQHVKLEDGKVILEDSGLPELDLSSLLQEEDGYTYSRGTQNAFTVGDKLVMSVYGDQSEILVIVDLQDGTSSETELGETYGEIVAGPDGSVLITRPEWSESDNTVTIKVNSLNMESKEETELTTLLITNDSRINPLYDPEKDVMYFVKDGELWAMPQFDPERAEAVNDCPAAGDGMMLLPDGFVLVWLYDTVIVKNTDPSQRGSITLRINDLGWGTAMSETIYDMNNTRGDVSVVLQSAWGSKSDIMQAMINRDGHTDIYVLQYASNDFSALRNRDYLPDLSSNEAIVENTNRLYPYLQDAVKQNGKIIGIPLSFESATIGIDLEVWKQIGGTEEELPKTWNQFYDWLDTIPEKLEGQDATLVGSWYDNVSFRADLLEKMLSQYEVRMEKKGETDYAFASPEMCALVGRLNSLDYEALQISERREEGDEEEGYLYEDEKRPLLETYVSGTPSGDPQFKPLALSFAEDEDAILPVEISIAFMNPFAEHPQEAMEFLALATKNLSTYEATSAYSDQTEAIRSPYYEENLKWYTEYLEKLNKQLEEAEGEEREELEQNIKDMEQSMKDSDRYYWVVCPEEIERYQKWQNYFKVRGYSFINVLFGEDDKKEENEPSDYEKLFYSAESAKLSPEELLGALDKKVQMIRMERN